MNSWNQETRGSQDFEKKRKEVWLIAFMVYGLFLINMAMMIAPMMIITIIIATPKYSSVLWVATPLTGVAVGAVVA